MMDDMQDNQAHGMGNVLPEDGRLMRMLTESLEAKHVVEIGTANGYSAMWFLSRPSRDGRQTDNARDRSQAHRDGHEEFPACWSRATGNACRR